MTILRLAALAQELRSLGMTTAPERRSVPGPFVVPHPRISASPHPRKSGRLQRPRDRLPRRPLAALVQVRRFDQPRPLRVAHRELRSLVCDCTRELPLLVDRVVAQVEVRAATFVEEARLR